jgi:hypothetical protein
MEQRRRNSSGAEGDAGGGASPQNRAVAKIGLPPGPDPRPERSQQP